ncbi:hypothetical protein F9B85_07595 [Heliorestis acidaminivorans]|uniref:Uncharacterized protein n=1 Tax=Heliorestis acidaminivorans TaxID=553427 RepID=A0A6I0EYP1_9FIRM|nr:hypothetical protein [Heliorestis acidaminivorans]KAB2952522.1 hypothetical protein F9B85_07595 [Heliorestis acidaminivorans]
MVDEKERILREQLEVIKYRLELLGQIEEKLKEMRALAVYASTNDLSEEEVEKIQEWVDRLQDEIAQLNEEAEVFSKSEYIEPNRIIH